MYLNKSHYQFVADQLNQVCRKFNRLVPFRGTKKEFDANTCDESEKLIITFIKKLQSWNAVAWRERYPRELADQDPMDYVTKINQILWDDLNINQLLKALECIDYQCTDSKKYCESEIRGILKMIIDDCKNYLIEESPEYISAKWGL